MARAQMSMSTELKTLFARTSKPMLRPIQALRRAASRERPRVATDSLSVGNSRIRPGLTISDYTMPDSTGSPLLDCPQRTADTFFSYRAIGKSSRQLPKRPTDYILKGNPARLSQLWCAQSQRADTRRTQGAGGKVLASRFTLF